MIQEEKYLHRQHLWDHILRGLGCLKENTRHLFLFGLHVSHTLKDGKGLFSLWNVLKHAYFLLLCVQNAQWNKNSGCCITALSSSPLWYMKWPVDALWGAFIFWAFTMTVTLLWIDLPLWSRFRLLRRNTENSRWWWWWFEGQRDFCFPKNVATSCHLLDRLLSLGQRRKKVGEKIHSRKFPWLCPEVSYSVGFPVFETQPCALGGARSWFSWETCPSKWTEKRNLILNTVSSPPSSVVSFLPSSREFDITLLSVAAPSIIFFFTICIHLSLLICY